MSLPQYLCPVCGKVVLATDAKGGTAQGKCAVCKKVRTFPLPPVQQNSHEQVTRGIVRAN
jgi:phage FluMu protein Com